MPTAMPPVAGVTRNADVEREALLEDRLRRGRPRPSGTPTVHRHALVGASASREALGG